MDNQRVRTSADREYSYQRDCFGADTGHRRGTPRIRPTSCTARIGGRGMRRLNYSRLRAGQVLIGARAREGAAIPR
eukprot:scaffold14801_cov99-Phaeocystis_antarctica.AAC.1